MSKDHDNQLIINFIRPIYVFEYYIANGIVDYIIIFIGIMIGSFLNVFTFPSTLPSFQVGGFDIVGIIVSLIVGVLLIIDVLIWPLTDILLMVLFPSYALFIGAYIIIKLIVMIFYHDDLYSFAMDYIDDFKDHFKEYVIEENVP